MRRFPKTLLYIAVIGTLALCFDVLHTLGKDATGVLMLAIPAMIGLCGVHEWRNPEPPAGG